MMHAEEDTELLRRYAREQAQEAFAELVRRYLDFAYAAAFRQMDGRKDLAADVAQQAFIALARHAKALEHHPALAGWLYTTTRNLAAGTLRSERARKHREEAYAMDEHNIAPAVESGWCEVRPHLDALIEQLDDVGRDAVVRRFFANQKFAEMGAALHISEDAARMRAERALERLRILLGRRGITSTTAALGTLLAALPAGAAAPAGLATVVTSAVATVVPLAAPSAAVAAFSFMSTTKAVAIGSGLVALVVTGGIYLASQTNETRALSGNAIQTSSASAAAGPRTNAHVAPQATDTKPAAGSPNAERVGSRPSDSMEAQAVQAGKRATGETLEKDVLNKWLELANGPDFLQARTKQGYKLAQDAYADFIKQTGLSPQDADRLAVLLTEKRLAATNVAIAQLRDGIEPDLDSAEFRDAVVAEKAKTDQEIRSLLGEDRFHDFQDYTSQSQDGAVLTRVRRAIGDTPDALTPEQTVRLQQELRQSSDGRLFIAAASQFLSPPQLQALQAALATQLDIQRKRYRDALPPRPASP